MTKTILRLIAAIALSIGLATAVPACGSAVEDGTEQDDDD